MPYLLKKDKEKVTDNGGLELENHYSKLSAQDFAGHLNYLNFWLVKSWVKKNGLRYWVCACVIGTLILCVLEIWLKIVCPYERKKETENGTVE